MNFSSERLGLNSLGIGLAAYLIGTAFAAAATAHAVWRVSTVVLEQLAPAAEASRPRSVAALTPAPPTAVAAPAVRQLSVRRQAMMTPLADRWDGRWGGASIRPQQPRPRGSAAAPFGSSSRSPYRPYDGGLFGSDDDEDRPSGTFRTVCVRLCDGYYFPVSFAVPADRLERDRGVCESRCGAQGRLFIHRNPGGSFDDLRDLAGRPYGQLRTAYLYRTEYVPSCTCQPQPWEQASLDRHRVYALTAAVNKGNRDAAKELQALQSKVKEAAKLAGQPTLLSGPTPVDGTRPATAAMGSAKAAEIAGREDGAFMGLGGNGASKPKSEPAPFKSGSNLDWMKRAFDR